MLYRMSKNCYLTMRSVVVFFIPKAYNYYRIPVCLRGLLMATCSSMLLFIKCDCHIKNQSCITMQHRALGVFVNMKVKI